VKCQIKCRGSRVRRRLFGPFGRIFGKTTTEFLFGCTESPRFGNSVCPSPSGRELRY
jgi:hypothetical protein